jgi:hypothetical protein
MKDKINEMKDKIIDGLLWAVSWTALLWFFWFLLGF